MSVNLKKYKGLLVTAVILALLLLFVAWQLFASIKNHTEAKEQLQSQTSRLAQLNSRNPYPAPENLAVEQENYNELVDYYNELNDSLRSSQVLQRPMETADFTPLLENTLRRLRDGFAGSGAALPQNFAFGFARYAGGQMPAPDDIPRLVQQLEIIESLCQAVMLARVTEVIDVSREEFETSLTAAATGSRRGAVREEPEHRPEEAPNQLFTSQEFVLTLRGSEPSIMRFLNNLAALPTFTVVTSLELQNMRVEEPKPETKDARTARGEVKKDLEEKPKERQVIIGREDLKAKIVMHVYQFGPSLPWGGTESRY